MDWADEAQTRTEQERAAMEARIRRAAQGAGRTTCAECGAPIGAARRQALPWAVRCLECQAEHECKRLG